MREPSAAQKKYLKMERKKRRTVIFMRLFLFLAFLLIWELAAELSGSTALSSAAHPGFF